MKIPVWILSTLLLVLVGVQGWTLTAIVDLKVSVAGIQATLAAQSNSQPSPASSQAGKVAVNNP